MAKAYGNTAGAERTVVVIGGLPSSLINFRGELLRRLKELGFRVVAIAGQLDSDSATVGQLRELGVEPESVTMQRTGTSIVGDLASCVQLYRILRRVRPDVLITYTAKPVIYGSLMSALAGGNRRFALITGLGYAFTSDDRRRGLLRRLMNVLYRMALRRNDIVFFQNPDDRDEFKRLGITRSHQRVAITNGSGVDTDYFAPVALPAAPAFLLIGRLLKDKGVYEYVGAARKAREENPDLRFLLVGPLDSNPSAISRNELDAWQAEGVIEYLGALDDVRPAIAQCSVYVLPSYREGTPRTVLEAMSMGRAVITTDVPGCRETVEDGRNGCLIPARNEQALAAAVLAYASSPQRVLAHGRAARQLAENKYNVHTVNAALLKEMALC